MLGGRKEPAAEEQVTIDFAFATVVTTKDIRRGEVLSSENLWVKRPGIGAIRAEQLEELYGKRVNKNIDRDEHLNWEDFD
jgi:N-acetylneuraminate synthase